MKDIFAVKVDGKSFKDVVMNLDIKEDDEIYVIKKVKECEDNDVYWILDKVLEYYKEVIPTII